MDRQSGEATQDLIARIRQDAVTCDFPLIPDPLDVATRTKFICSALFKVKECELTFAKAIEIAIEAKDTAKVAKETLHGLKYQESIDKVQ